MNFELVTHYSSCLNRNMNVGIWGHSGKIMLAFAAQDGKYDNFMGYGQMAEVLAPWIDVGKLMVVSVDSIDEETWSDKFGNPGHRAWLQEQWFHYLTDEAIPMVQHKYNNFGKMISTGCSMGGFHSANIALRRPDLFDGCISMSGFFKAELFFGGYMDNNLYNNSPVHYIGGMSPDHPYVGMYNNSNFRIVSGQGAWEEELLPSNRELCGVCASKGINIWFDYWGYDVAHDWPWWRKQIVYHLNQIIPL